MNSNNLVQWSAAISDDPQATVSEAVSVAKDALFAPIEVTQVLLPKAVQGDSIHIPKEHIDGKDYVLWEDAQRYADWRVEQALKVTGCG